MLYNRVKEHVVNDRKKMYKRGSQWVVVSAFALALGGVALTQLQPVNAAETDTHLVVQPVTLTQDGQVSQPAAAQTEPASAVKNTQPVATANAAKANGEASPAAAQQQATAAYQAASQAANANTSMPASSGMTEAEWQAQQAKYDQAKSDAAVSEAAEKQKTSEAEASYANSLASQAAAQKQQDQASLAAASSSAASSLAALQSQQASSYAAASQSANAQIDSLNAQRTSGQPADTVSDGGTFDYVAKNGLWTNVVNYNDSGKTWNGNYLVQNLPVFKDPNAAGMMDDIYVHADDEKTPSWSLGDVVNNNQLTAAQKNELNQYAMMLVNNYRESMGLSPISTTLDFLNKVQQRGDSLRNGHMLHNPSLTSQIFGHSMDETLTSVDFSSFMGNRYNQNPTMMEVMEGVASSINGLLNYDGDSDNGHRNILLGGDTTTGFSLQYNTTDNVWIMNSNGDGYIYQGANIATVPAQTSTPSTGQDNNKEIDQKIQTVKDNLQSLKNSQNQTYQTQKISLNNAVQQLADQFASQEAQAEKDNDSKIQTFNAQQESALASFIAALTKQVEALNPGPKPSTPSSGASSSGASSATSSSSSSAASSSASSAGSSAASSAASSSASSAGSSAASSAASSSASSAGSSAASSAASSSASSAGSSAASSAASSSASSAGSSAASSAASSSASSAGSSAASSAASSSASSAANPKTSSAAVIPVVAAQPSSSQPMSRVAQKNGKHAYPATGESQAGAILAEAGAVVIAVLGLAGVRKYRHAK
ncbi:SEC10/PgrA surface exclusion domain-containing protein [Lacticaseibacillus paracasei]|uniref:SEC10/PgrA surface exclusion domain-containing protein n=1 Tax=Lacticaseibacillus paracasei TaxID=1597 RepID=UPI0022EC23DB|nr:SEC10/PgrA surface exclusion domain-containing protein [Lacticaseibacillus paracasei]WBS99272.1 SEC10/PgrA surface exclusion domain-containing protein [Lacticaseibacillus paracasei]